MRSSRVTWRRAEWWIGDAEHADEHSFVPGRLPANGVNGRLEPGLRQCALATPSRSRRLSGRRRSRAYRGG